MKKWSLILIALMVPVVLTLSSCSVWHPMPQTMPQNRGHRHVVTKKGTHINDVVRVKGRPYHRETYRRGNSRIDELYYLQPVWGNQRRNNQRVVIRYRFRNSYLQNTKEMKLKQVQKKIGHRHPNHKRGRGYR
ncbi:MAG: hypothetical protein Q4E10_00790 [Porphyromonas sp.]|nr:hypothetical protein [Porphyromonas sp.]